DEAERDDADPDEDDAGGRQSLGQVAHHWRPRCVGSRASRSASPTRLNDSASTTIAMPGKNTSHGAPRKKDWLSKMMLPQEGVGGRTPTPRNDSIASNITVVAMPSVA